jgi:Domain of unknown function (DUF4381)
MRRLLHAAAWLALAPAIVRAAEDLPQLQPPHGELPPTFWEQHAWVVIFAALVALVLLVLLIFWLRRPRPAMVIPPDVVARRALESLCGQEENGLLLMNVSGILRRYVIFACGLPPGELTTAELCRAVAVRPQFSPDLATAITGFFRQCDECKFAPDPPASSFGAVAGALALLEKIELRRRQMSGSTSPTLPLRLPPPVPKSAAVPPPL